MRGLSDRRDPRVLGGDAVGVGPKGGDRAGRDRERGRDAREGDPDARPRAPLVCRSEDGLFHALAGASQRPSLLLDHLGRRAMVVVACERFGVVEGELELLVQRRHRLFDGVEGRAPTAQGNQSSHLHPKLGLYSTHV